MRTRGELTDATFRVSVPDLTMRSFSAVAVKVIRVALLEVVNLAGRERLLVEGDELVRLRVIVTRMVSFPRLVDAEYSGEDARPGTGGDSGCSRPCHRPGGSPCLHTQFPVWVRDESGSFEKVSQDGDQAMAVALSRLVPA